MLSEAGKPTVEDCYNYFWGVARGSLGILWIQRSGPRCRCCIVRVSKQTAPFYRATKKSSAINNCRAHIIFYFFEVWTHSDHLSSCDTQLIACTFSTDSIIMYGITTSNIGGRAIVRNSLFDGLLSKPSLFRPSHVWSSTSWSRVVR